MDRILKLKMFHLVVISLFVVLAFLPSLGGEFVNWDDQSHVVDNAAVRSFDVRRMFTETVQKIYIPLTSLSFAVEHRFFGNEPFVYHLDNLLLHLFNTLLVYFLLQRLGLSVRAAFWAALLFGVHPMRVESVAWVTERKDVLYAFFYLWAIFFYSDYLKSRRWNVYLGALIFGLLSMLAKPMAASLPLILLLVDWYAKRRWDIRVLLDKIPFFALIIPLAWITYSLNPHVHQPGGSTFLISAWSAVFYIRKFLWPDVLVPLYKLPLPVDWSTPAYPAAVGLCLLIILLVFFFRKNRWVLFAAVYFLLSIVFVLGLNPSTVLSVVDDRYMYLPSLGFCAVFGFWADRGLYFSESHKKYLMPMGVLSLWLIVGALSLKSITQARIWNDSVALWTYVIRYNPTEFLAFNDRAVSYIYKGYYDLALADYGAILTFDPDNADVYFNRGLLYVRLKRYSSAVEDFGKVIRQYPYYERAYNHRGMAHEAMGDQQAALADYERTIAVSPDFPDGYLNRGNIFNHQGSLSRALADYDRAIVLNPRFDRAMNNRGTVYAKLSDDQRALDDFNQAIALDPKYAEAYYNRSVIFNRRGQNVQALEDALNAKTLGASVPENYIQSLR